MRNKGNVGINKKGEGDMILILQLLTLIALVSCASRVISEAIEWFFFGRRAAQGRDELVG